MLANALNLGCGSRSSQKSHCFLCSFATLSDRFWGKDHFTRIQEAVEEWDKNTSRLHRHGGGPDWLTSGAQEDAVDVIQWVIQTMKEHFSHP